MEFGQNSSFVPKDSYQVGIVVLTSQRKEAFLLAWGSVVPWKDIEIMKQEVWISSLPFSVEFQTSLSDHYLGFAILQCPHM